MINLDEIKARVAKDKEVRAEDLKTNEILQIRVDRKRLLREVEGLKEQARLQRPIELHGEAAEAFVLAAELSEAKQLIE